MNILYISTSCSDQKYADIYNLRTVKTIEPQQKFNSLLIKGIAATDTEVTALSVYPVSSSTCSIKFFDYEEEYVNENLKYKYLPFRNGKITRLWDTYSNSKKYVERWIVENAKKECCILVDALSMFMIMGSFKMAKKYGIPVVGIITDLPKLTTNMKARKEPLLKKIALNAIQKLNTSTLNKYDGFITLTESIYQSIDKKNIRPHIIVEGSVDSRLSYEKKQNESDKVIVYAGGVYEKYGVKNLVEAFLKLDSDFELHIYGDGAYVPELIELSKKHQKVQYKGMATLEEIVEIERNATLLVNPRPSNEKFSKYSFPSKTLEYMASGTPLLSTRLPGIPPEYFNYIYAIDDDSVDGIYRALLDITDLDVASLKERGRKAYVFVQNKKSNIKQGQAIVKFVKSL